MSQVVDPVQEVLVSERIAQVEERLGTLEALARSSDKKLGQLVALEERRDRRDEATAKLDREERAARSTWLRSVGERLLVPVLSALGSGGLVAGWYGSHMAHEAQPPPAASAPAPQPHVGP